MSASLIHHPVLRSLTTAWTKSPDGPRWAPWGWTILINTVIGLVLGAVGTGHHGGYLPNLVISQAIGLSIHLLFWGLGHLLALDMFGMPLRLRLAYVAMVVLSGSWIGFSAAILLITRDPRLTVQILQQAWGGLIAMPLLWAGIMFVTLTAVNRYRTSQLAAERADLARLRADREAIAARLALLNAQIEPHFLYNTLAHVRALTGKDPAAAQGMIDSLIDYLRASSRNMARTLVGLDEEMDSVRGYLEVMQRRLGARLRVVWAVPTQAWPLQVPPACLQTLVENAIKHGIEPAPEGGEIRIEASRQGADWLVEVVNTGAGLGESRPGSGTGLENLRERLRLSLGERAGVTLESQAGTTRASLRLVTPAAGAGDDHARTTP